MTPAQAHRELYTIAEAAAELRVSKRTVYRMVAAGEFPRLVNVARKGAKKTRTRIRHEDLVRHIDRNTRSIA
ncbi:helix-turn-helix domain-containing protein [Streptomonospora wellingtoniae]|uniref:Helix-turn-helix domain-containing protein n=1 Tax=Streptomonospora wellingtoniae TaxID=3075544 RepID=A0ABU2KUK6_9ACTN|nr:helix-turn-helix domain-containing protein [Streptomonospora sp. DSM 45055]MDT0302964.1 helix-turn-helix domain-containing protein [Streptomonospora sp. DSM 45055]